MKQRTRAFLLLFIISPLFLSGCELKQEEKKAIILRWVTDPNPLRKEQIARFEKANPGIKINLDWASQGMAKIIVQTAGGDPPDLFDCHSPEELKTFASKGILLDITKRCERDRVPLHDIWPQCHDYIYYQGKVYGFPANAGTIVLFYNKTVFDEEGVPYPDETLTWDKFLEIAKKLTKIDTEKKIYTQFGAGLSFLDYFLPWQYGADFYSQDGKRCTADSKEYKEAIRFMYDLRYKYHVVPTPIEIQNMSSKVSGWGSGDQNLFASGRLAMLCFGRYGVITMRKVKNLDWGIAPVPYPENGRRVTWFGSRSTVISSKTKYPEEAFKFLNFLFSEEYNKTIINNGDGIPAVISIAKSDLFLHDPGYPKENQNQIYIKAVDYSRPTHVSPYFNEIEVNKIKVEEIEDKMWGGLQSPELTLDKVARRVNALINK